MIKTNSGRSPIFVEGSITTLQIPSKLRLKTEPTRLPVQVLEHKNRQYKLQCQYGRLSGRYQGRQLNSVDQSTADIFEGAIRPAPEKNGRKEVIISFAKAVVQENKRRSVTSVQKAGRATKKAPEHRVTQAPQTGGSKGTKQRQTAENAEPIEPVQGVKHQRRGQGPVSVVVPVLGPSPQRLCQRG
jgi:hypothetical protein